MRHSNSARFSTKFTPIYLHLIPRPCSSYNPFLPPRIRISRNSYLNTFTWAYFSSTPNAFTHENPIKIDNNKPHIIISLSTHMHRRMCVPLDKKSARPEINQKSKATLPNRIRKPNEEENPIKNSSMI